MKKFLLIALTIGTMLSCSQDTEIQNITADLTVPAITNLKTFTPDARFNESSLGKYVGVFGHHNNRDLHGKIYINAGADTRYSALIELVSGQELYFEGTATRNEHVFMFTGDHGSFTANFKDSTSPVFENVYIDGAEDASYIVAKKEIEGNQIIIILGFYLDPDDPNFFGAWNLMGDQATQQTTVRQTGLTPPLPEFYTALTQDIDQLVITHNNNTTPIVINNFGVNAGACDLIPGFNPPTINPSVTFIPEFGSRLVSAGGQTSSVLGFDLDWTLIYRPQIPNLPYFETYFRNDCALATSGTWTYRNRTGICKLFP